MLRLQQLGQFLIDKKDKIRRRTHMYIRTGMYIRTRTYTYAYRTLDTLRLMSRKMC